MKQAIEKIMHVVTVTVHPNNTVNLDLSETGIKMLLDTSSIDIESIRRRLVACLFNLDKQSDIESLVQNYQSVIIRLLNDLYSYQVNHGKNKNLVKLYTSLSEYLSDILSYIENYFSKYFNIDEKVPHIYYSIISKDFLWQLSKLNLQLKGKSVDQELIEIIFSTFSMLNSDRNKNTVTYRNLIYLKEFLSELSSIFLDVNPEDLNVVIRNLLIYLNFNHPAFIAYLIDKLSQEVNDQESQQEKVLKLKFRQKGFNQMNYRPGVALHKDIVSVKEQIITWIEEEIIFLQCESNVLKQTIIDEQKNDHELKINTSLSVPQLAYFIRLLVENKTITNINQTEILKFFSLHFTSLKRENMSYGHLRSQYYKIEMPAVESIKSLLLTLVNLSRKIK